MVLQKYKIYVICNWFNIIEITNFQIWCTKYSYNDPMTISKTHYHGLNNLFEQNLSNSKNLFFRV
jgi:hypothetical protein